jgi:hypothetical protein
MASTLSRFHVRTQTHHIRYDSFVWVIVLLQKPLPGHTQHSRETDIHVRAILELIISANERLQFHALDREATGIDLSLTP